MAACAINNVKVSCKVTGPSIKRTLQDLSCTSDSVTRKSSNFFVLRSKYVYIIFFTGHVNITGVRSVNEVANSCIHLKGLLHNKDLEISTPSIDNICSSGSVRDRVDLYQLAVFLQKNGYQFCFNPHKFPGLSIAPLENAARGTFTIFSSGKFILVGLKSSYELDSVTKVFFAIIEKYLRANQPSEQLNNANDCDLLPC